jgi:hypothetical protein
MHRAFCYNLLILHSMKYEYRYLDLIGRTGETGKKVRPGSHHTDRMIWLCSLTSLLQLPGRWL